MKAIVIVDNIGNEKAKGEWGLCIYIEYNGKHILLDTGGSNLFAANLKQLGIDIQDIDYAILSHAHIDHASGMAKFFEENNQAKFYLQEGTQENCYFKLGLIKAYVGIPRGILKQYSNRIQFVSGIQEIIPGMYLIPHNRLDDSKGKVQHMYIQQANSMKPDSFSHEQSLVFKTSQGLVIFNSCCHGGADCIIEEVQALFPNEAIVAIIGGFHIAARKASYISNLANRIQDTNIQKVYTGHCTKQRGFKLLQKELGNQVEMFYVGMTMEF